MRLASATSIMSRLRRRPTPASSSSRPMHFGIRNQRGSLPHALGPARCSAPWAVLRHVPRAGLWIALAVVGIPAAHGQTSLDTVARPTGALRSGDLLNIRVYRDSELTGQYLLDAR